MLIRFSVQNFKTFRERAILDLIASNSDKDTREEENVVLDEKLNLRILKSAVMYGANASGKSKFIEALLLMKEFVVSSSKETQTGEKIDVDPFRLNEASENEPSEFEITFEIEGVLYRYGFEANQDRVVAEWLFYKPKTKEIQLFYREDQKFEIHLRQLSKARAITKEGLVRKNALLLSVAAQFNEPLAIVILEWFKKCKIISGLHEVGFQGFTMNQINNPLQKKKIIELLKGADLGIYDLSLERLDIEKLPSSIPKAVREKLEREVKEGNKEFYSDTKVTHRRYNLGQDVSTPVQFSMDEDESSGTEKFFALSGPILDVLENGYTLIVDELDSKLHPNLVCKIVELFNSKETNPHNAQLIFNTHDTNLLSSGLFRRDQIWFIEKNEFGEARLYSLGDFKSDEVRKNEAFEDNYIRGKYGAIPYLGMFDNLEPSFLLG